VLEGKERFENHVLRYGENLAFATNHDPSHNSAELLQSPGVGPVLADIEAHYGPDLILFDMPPMLGADDALAFLAHTDCALLVAAAESTSIADVDGCERDLAERSNVLGVVLNKCRYMTRKSDYGYY
jgi:Mrp family chromosome partitioning ATPase